MKTVVAIVLLLSSHLAYSADNYTRNYISSASMMSYTGQINPVFAWVSTVSTESKPTYFTNSSGASIMANPSSVVSGYDSTSTRYNVSNFYALKSDRYKLISHINGFNKGEILSIGYDSGINAEKLNVNNSFFVGYAKTMAVTQSSLFNISIGSWFGGNIKESPCVDSYGRQYSCQSLTAWSDYKPNYPRPLSFLDLKYIWVFD